MDSFPVLSRASSRNMERDWDNGSIASSITSVEYNGEQMCSKELQLQLKTCFLFTNHIPLDICVSLNIKVCPDIEEKVAGSIVFKETSAGGGHLHILNLNLC